MVAADTLTADKLAAELKAIVMSAAFDLLVAVAFGLLAAVMFEFAMEAAVTSM